MNTQSPHQKTKARVEVLADLLDNQFEGPLGYRFGLDGVLGLIPGVGDLITNSMAFLIIGQATVDGYPISILLRMILNLLIENVVDAIPLIGNLFDFFWKSNSKNVGLMKAYQITPHKLEKRSKWFLIGVIGLLCLLFIAVTAASILIIVWFFKEIF